MGSLGFVKPILDKIPTSSQPSSDGSTGSPSRGEGANTLSLSKGQGEVITNESRRWGSFPASVLILAEESILGYGSAIWSYPSLRGTN